MSEPQRIWRTAFFASILLNAFLASALVATVLIAYRTLGAWPTWSPTSTMSKGSLTPAERRGFRDKLREARPTISPIFEEARQSREAVRTLLLNPDFDRAATEQALARSRDIEARLKVEVDRVMLEYVATLPPERRIVVGDTLRPGRRVFDMNRPSVERTNDGQP